MTMSKMNSKLMLALVLPLGMALAPPIASSAQSATGREWNAIMQATMSVAPTNPNFQAGWGAITQLAVFEAVNAIVGDYQPYLGVIDALLRPGSAAALDAARAASLAAIPDGPAKEAGILVGALSAPSQAQPPGGGSNTSVTTTVIHPVATWSGGCMISGNVKAIITATRNISGTASVVLKVKPMGCNGSCGMVNGQFTASTTVTIGAPVAISGTLNSNYPHCDFSYASAVCTFVVNADGTAKVNSMVLHTGCFD